MKKINVIITVLIFSLFISCKKDILTENPKTLVVEDFYNTNGQVEAALASIYAPIRGQLGSWMIGAIECQTEWGAGIVGATNFDGHKTMQGLDAVPANNIVAIWDNLYLGIRNANLVIKMFQPSFIFKKKQAVKIVMTNVWQFTNHKLNLY